MYADYTYYTSEYGGTLISSEPLFNKYSKRASAYIDAFTYGRLTSENKIKYATLPECCCEIAEYLFVISEQKQNGDIKSESIDGYSVTYRQQYSDGKSNLTIAENEAYKICKLWLGNTGLLYLGVDVDASQF